MIDKSVKKRGRPEDNYKFVLMKLFDVERARYQSIKRENNLLFQFLTSFTPEEIEQKLHNLTGFSCLHFEEKDINDQLEISTSSTIEIIKQEIELDIPIYDQISENIYLTRQEGIKDSQIVNEADKLNLINLQKENHDREIKTQNSEKIKLDRKIELKNLHKKFTYLDKKYNNEKKIDEKNKLYDRLYQIYEEFELNAYWSNDGAEDILKGEEFNKFRPINEKNNQRKAYYLTIEETNYIIVKINFYEKEFRLIIEKNLHLIRERNSWEEAFLYAWELLRSKWAKDLNSINCTKMERGDDPAFYCSDGPEDIIHYLFNLPPLGREDLQEIYNYIQNRCSKILEKFK